MKETRLVSKYDSVSYDHDCDMLARADFSVVEASSSVSQDKLLAQAQISKQSRCRSRAPRTSLFPAADPPISVPGSLSDRELF